MPNRFYSEEEAQQILSMAARDAASDSMSREELIRAAAEMGISAEAIHKAEVEIERQRMDARAAEEAKVLRAEYRRYQLDQVWSAVGGFLSAAVFFSILWWIFGHGYYWPIWIVIWPLIGAVTCGIGAFFPGPKRQRKYEQWLEKRGRRQDPQPSLVMDFGAQGKE